MGCITPVYRPRDAEHTVLHQVIAEHLEAFLRAVAEAGDGAGLPQFVEREFRESTVAQGEPLRVAQGEPVWRRDRTPSMLVSSIPPEVSCRRGCDGR
jgi:hypothetical protein